MGTGITEDLPDPAVEDVQQREWPLPAMPVKPTGPVQTHELPSRVAVARPYAVGASTFEQVSGENLKRKRILLLASDKGFTYSTSGSSSTGVAWPINVPLELRNAGAVYVKATTAGDTSTVQVIEEVWAD